MTRRAIVFVSAVACAGGVSSSNAPVAKSGSCADEYARIEENWATYMPREKATSPFAHCPRWHRAMPEACGAHAQPSFIDPCQCLCDLCEKDADCGPGATCATMASTICGGTTERVCVRDDDACSPKNAPTCATRCVSLFGKPRCISAEDERLCRR